MSAVTYGGITTGDAVTVAWRDVHLNIIALSNVLSELRDVECKRTEWRISIGDEQYITIPTTRRRGERAALKADYALVISGNENGRQGVKTIGFSNFVEIIVAEGILESCYVGTGCPDSVRSSLWAAVVTTQRDAP